MKRKPSKSEMMEESNIHPSSLAIMMAGINKTANRASQSGQSNRGRNTQPQWGVVYPGGWEGGTGREVGTTITHRGGEQQSHKAWHTHLTSTHLRESVSPAWRPTPFTWGTRSTIPQPIIDMTSNNVMYRRLLTNWIQVTWLHVSFFMAAF